MEYNVKSGKRIATIDLDGTECAVKFGSTYNVFEVRNNGSAPVLMALGSGATEGDDGAVSVPAGGSFCYPHMQQLDTVYLTGSGEVIVLAKNDTNPSFKSALAGGQGGGGGGTVTVDSFLSDTSENPVQNKVVKAALDEKANFTDIPTSLPANGGNASYLNGFSSDSFLKCIANIPLKTSIDKAYTPGTYSCEQSYTPDFPTNFGGIFGLLNVYAYGSICYQTLMLETGAFLYRAQVVGQLPWSEWVNLAGVADNVVANNAVYQGKNLGASVTDKQSITDNSDSVMDISAETEVN